MRRNTKKNKLKKATYLKKNSFKLLPSFESKDDDNNYQ